jgi:RecB family exonuclease
MPLEPDLLEAYRNAEYAVFAEREIVLRVGEPNAQLDALLAEHGTRIGAFVTAANPRGEPRPEAENAVANSALQNLVSAAGYPHYFGEGRDARRTWAEPSFLVVGIYRQNAEALGTLFEQNAIVFCEAGRAPELVLLDSGAEP